MPLMPISSLKTNPAAATSPQQPMTAGLIVLILSTLLGSQPVTTDLYLPALPMLTESFAASMPLAAQRTLSVLLLAFCCSQLIWGRYLTALTGGPFCCVACWPAFARRQAGYWLNCLAGR